VTHRPRRSSKRSHADEYGRQFAGIYDALFPRAQITSREIAWLASHPSARPPVRVLELGVGTGRVAIPLATELAARGDVCFDGMDISRDMLRELRRADARGLVRPLLADMTETLPAHAYDLILCLCGTISQVTDSTSQQRTFSNAASRLAVGGHLIVETHNAALVGAMHSAPETTLAVPYPDGRRALVSFSRLEGSAWQLEHCWIESGTATFLSERSRLTSLTELDDYARAAGLDPVGHWAGLSGQALAAHSPMVTGVYRKR
jgi:SAM-dependent methyltransferase